MRKKPDQILTKRYIIYLALVLLAFVLNITLSLKEELNVYSFIILILICCFEIVISIDKALNPSGIDRELGEIDNPEYIETGYEDKLNDVINNENISSIFINGEFGSGKSTILDYVIEKYNNNKKVLYIEPYDEFIEENFIDFLYELCLSRDDNAFFQRDKVIIIPTILLILSALIMYFLNQSKSAGLLSIVMLLTINGIAVGFTKFKVYKEDKIKYIKEELKKYDYIVIDDLDRIYIESKEIIKMVHFMSKNEVLYNVKLIMLGDTLKFTENGIDVLEKYYEYKFEIPSEIIKTNFINKLHETIIPKYDYKDDLHMLPPIWRQMSTRNIKKIITHLNWEAKSEYVKVTEKLYNSDYLYILTLSINNIVNLDELFKTIEFIGENHSFIGEAQSHIERDISLLEADSLNLTKEEYEYLKSCYCEYKGLVYSKNSSVQSNKRVRTKNSNRIFNQPIQYKLNSYMSIIKSQQEILEKFDVWLESDPDKIEYYDLIIYSETNHNTILEKLVESCECIKRCPLVFRAYLAKEYSPNNSRVKENINIYFNVKTYIDGDYDNTSDYDIIADLLINNWNELWTSTKLEMLERESALKQGNIVIDYLLESEENSIVDIIEYMIESNSPNYFYNIFEDKLKKKELDQELIKEIIKMLDIHIEKLHKQCEEYDEGHPFRRGEKMKIVEVTDHIEKIRNTYLKEVSNAED